MNIQRVFLDWKRPALAAAVDYLFEQFATAGQLDLEQVVLALPGSRAGRRLLEILVAEAQRRQLPLCPPRIVTAGELPELLYEAKRPFADTLVQQLAWIEALRKTDPRHLRDDRPGCPARMICWPGSRWARCWAALHRELAADGLDFSKVVPMRLPDRRLSRDGPLAGAGRDPKAVSGHARRSGFLGPADRAAGGDPQPRMPHGEADRACRCTGPEPLATDNARPGGRARDGPGPRPREAGRSLRRARLRPPRGLADGDDPACRTSKWKWSTLPADQAEAVVRAIAGFDGRYNTEQIAIGVPDEQIVPYLQQQLQQCGLPARYGVGTAVPRSAPYRLLAAVADYLETASFSAFAALLRHPAVHDWLSGQDDSGRLAEPVGRLPCATICPARRRAVARRRPAAGDRSGGSTRPCRVLPLIAGPAAALDQWAQPIVDLLVDMLRAAATPQRRRARPDHPGRLRTKSTTRWGSMRPSRRNWPVAHQHRGPAADAAADRRGCVPPPPDRGAIELLGWLELPLDDAPALIVTGFNEGRVPSSLNADLFLPNQLRRALGIEDNDRRYARDAYALSLLAASREATATDRRPAERRGRPAAAQPPAVRLRRYGDGQAGARPSSPTRSGPPARGWKPAACCRARTVAAGSAPAAAPGPADHFHAGDGVQRLPGLPLPLLSAARAEAGEPGRLGRGTRRGGASARWPTRCSARWARTPLAAAPPGDDRQVPRATARRKRAGQFRQGAAAVRSGCRSSSFGCGWRPSPAGRPSGPRQGWRIEYTEVSPESGKAFLEVDGQPMLLRGRIDRIDVHEPSGQRMIFDYKIVRPGENAGQGASQARASGSTCNCRCTVTWRPGWGSAAPVELAYIVLPKDTRRVEALTAEWTAEDFADRRPGGGRGDPQRAERKSSGRPSLRRPPFQRALCGHLPGRSLRRGDPRERGERKEAANP